MPVKSVLLHSDVVDSILTYSRSAYPREGILVLRGKSKKGVVEVESLMIPPMAVHGEGFASFNWHLLPIDLSFVGVAHSHPSGYAVPSHQDLLHAMGKIMVIAGYPYADRGSIKVYDVHGNPLQFDIK